MKFRILRTFKTIPQVVEPIVIGKPSEMRKQEVARTLQVQHSIGCDWEDVPFVDYDDDTGEYIEDK